MTGRIPFGLLTLLTVLACAPIQAQDQSGPAPGYGVQPAGYQPFHDDAGQYHPLPYTYQRDPGPQLPGPPPRRIYEQLPDDLGFTDGDTPLGNALTETFRHSWFRAEYLFWSVSGPGSGIMGAQAAGGVPVIQQPNAAGIVSSATTATVASNLSGGSPFIPISQGVQFNRTVNSVSGLSQSPSMYDFSFANLNGFRGTYGLPLPVGQIELSAFVLASSTATFSPGGLIQSAQTAIAPATPGGQFSATLDANGNPIPAQNAQSATFISQALLVNGVAQPYSSTSSAFIDYDVSFHSRLTMAVWGSEGNYVFDSRDPNSPFQIRPSVGFRYFNYRDNLDQGGQYHQGDPANPTAPAVVVGRDINSGANNNLLGPQVGLRAEFTQSQFLLGFEPKLMMGLNTYSQTLNTANVLSNTDPAQNILQRGTTFSPLLDLKFYGNVSLSKNLSAYASYNFLYTSGLVKSSNDVTFNKDSTTNQSDFLLNKVYSTGMLQGISLGFDFRY